MQTDRAGESSGLQAELNITPLIDVMLVLLIIFMVAVPAMTRTVGFKLPVGDSKPIEEVRVDPVRLQLEADGRIALNGEVMSKAQLDYALRVNSALQPQPLLQVAVADGARYETVAGVMAGAHSAGFRAITLEP